jgi:hypothetical protein
MKNKYSLALAFSLLKNSAPKSSGHSQCILIQFQQCTQSFRGYFKLGHTKTCRLAQSSAWFWSEYFSTARLEPRWGQQLLWWNNLYVLAHVFPPPPSYPPQCSNWKQMTSSEMGFDRNVLPLENMAPSASTHFALTSSTCFYCDRNPGLRSVCVRNAVLIQGS